MMQDLMITLNLAYFIFWGLILLFSNESKISSDKGGNTSIH